MLAPIRRSLWDGSEVNNDPLVAQSSDRPSRNLRLQPKTASSCVPPTSGASASTTKENAPIELGHPVPTAERERAIDLAPVELERPEDAVFAGTGDAPEVRASDQHGACAERERLEHVDAAAEAAVDQDRRSAA